jgi:hypothetical protein
MQTVHLETPFAATLLVRSNVDRALENLALRIPEQPAGSGLVVEVSRDTSFMHANCGNCMIALLERYDLILNTLNCALCRTSRPQLYHGWMGMVAAL